MLDGAMSTILFYIIMQIRVRYNDYVDSEKQSSNSGFSQISEVSRGTEALRILAKLIANVHMKNIRHQKTGSSDNTEREQ
jgi:hypothetical protein